MGVWSSTWAMEWRSKSVSGTRITQGVGMGTEERMGDCREEGVEKLGCAGQLGGSCEGEKIRDLWAPDLKLQEALVPTCALIVRN